MNQVPTTVLIYLFDFIASHQKNLNLLVLEKAENTLVFLSFDKMDICTIPLLPLPVPSHKLLSGLHNEK